MRIDIDTCGTSFPCRARRFMVMMISPGEIANDPTTKAEMGGFMKTQKILGLLACASVAALTHHSASAQQPGGQASSAGQLEEIVVTAEKRSENQQVVPVSVTALSPTVLANARILNAMDLSGTVPNLFIMQGASMNGSTSTPWLTLRGIEANNTGTVQTDSG